jgi:hypothetical protein
MLSLEEGHHLLYSEDGGVFYVHSHIRAQYTTTLQKAPHGAFCRENDGFPSLLFTVGQDYLLTKKRIYAIIAESFYTRVG